jgi:uncharacterized protein YeeX (DUF496 family)
MALPIKPTPILTGKDAKAFAKKIKDNETRPLSKKEIDDYLRAKVAYEEINPLYRQ